MDSAKSIKIEPINMDGLNDFFQNDSRQIEDLQHSDIKLDTGLNIKEAATYYNLSIASIRLKIKLGEIPAIKISGKTGPEWAIFPKGIPDNYQKDTSSLEEIYHHIDSSPIEDFEKGDSTVIEEFTTGGDASLEALHQANANLGKFLDMQRELINKIETLTFKNGYLESQVREREEQIKLLPYLQAQAERAKKLQHEKDAKENALSELASKVSKLEEALEIAAQKDKTIAELESQLAEHIAEQEQLLKEKQKPSFISWLLGKKE
ncbi:hypothetical protein KA183_20725 [bacterium]|nr:hypothetical protein [bacterium]